MRNITATEAARKFADVLNAVETRGETFVVVRRGRAVACFLLRAHLTDRARNLANPRGDESVLALLVHDGQLKRLAHAANRTPPPRAAGIRRGECAAL